MSDQEHLDNLFKDAFSDYRPAVPEGTWDKIAAARGKRRRPGFLLWSRTGIVAIMLGSLLLGGAVLLMQQHEDGTTSTAATSQHSSVDETMPGSSQPTNNTDGNAETKAGKLAQTSAADKDNGTINNTNTGNSSIINVNMGGAAATGDALDPATTLPSTRDIAYSTTNARNKKTVNADNKQQRNGNRIRQHKGKRNIDARQDQDDDIIIDATANNVTATFSHTAEDKTSIFSDHPERLLFQPEKLRAVLTLHPLTMQRLKEPGCPGEENIAGNKSYWEVYGGPDYAIKNYTDTNGSLLVQKRKESMRFQSGFSVGARFTRVFANGMSIRAGLNYSELVEKFTFLHSNVVQLNYEIDPVSGDTLGSYFVRGSRYRNSYNIYRTLDLPINVGYEMGNGRFHANINAGAVINIRSWQNGETLDTNFQPVKFSSNESSTLYQYKTNIGVGFTAAASLYYKLNNNMHLLAEPYFRYNLSPVNTGALTIQEKFTTMGIRLGVRIDF